MSGKTTTSKESMLYWATKLKENYPPQNRKQRRTLLKYLRVMGRYEKQNQEITEASPKNAAQAS